MSATMRRRLAAVEAKARPDEIRVYYMPDPKEEPERYAAMEAELDAAREAGERVIHLKWRGGIGETESRIKREIFPP